MADVYRLLREKSRAGVHLTGEKISGKARGPQIVRYHCPPPPNRPRYHRLCGFKPLPLLCITASRLRPGVRCHDIATQHSSGIVLIKFASSTTELG